MSVVRPHTKPLRNRALRSLMGSGRTPPTPPRPEDAVRWGGVLTEAMIRAGSLPVPAEAAALIPEGVYAIADGTRTLRFARDPSTGGDHIARGARRLQQLGAKAGSRYELMVWPDVRRARVRLLAST